MLGCEALFAEWEQQNGLRGWARTLKGCVERALEPDRNGNLARWLEAISRLPEVRTDRVELNRAAVTCEGRPTAAQAVALEEGLRALSPWRKGPFQIFDTFIDTEWRSNLKWERLAPHLELEGKEILDVGCGNGYYGWRMLGAGASRVVGLDPSVLYSMQFAALRRFLGPLPNYVLTAADDVIPPNLRAFDTVFSMGVLYHRKSPIEHLQHLRHALRDGGELVLETLVIEGGDREVLIPDDRYAQMRNVWFIPSLGLLQRMVRKSGFRNVRVLDVTPTTVAEQRTTDWMAFESLANFLDPADPSRTIEGYPGPVRAILSARR